MDILAVYKLYFNMEYEVCNKFNFKRSVILILLFIASENSTVWMSIKALCNNF